MAPGLCLYASVPVPLQRRYAMRRERSILINATPEAVYDYVSDVMHHPDWAAQKMEMKHTGGPDAGVGAEFESTVHFMGHVAGRLKVIEASRPGRFVYQC